MQFGFISTLACVPLAALPLPAPAQDTSPPLREFDYSAPGGTTFHWRALAGESEPGKGDGLRYAWTLPSPFERSKVYNLIVICHGAGLDFRWGPANHPPAHFRPRDIVISVDGPSPAPDGSRLFLGDPADALAFRTFILEIARTFPAGRIFLYGHSQGSFFVTYFLGEYPGLADGVVAHASGVWTWTRRGGSALDIPIAFMHGTNDPVVPFGQSLGGLAAYADDGHRALLLRRLPGYNHWPNHVRASECLDWCIGMKSDDPAEVLAAADALLALKPPDATGYTCAPPFGGARRVLLRLVAKGFEPLENVPSETARRAQDLLALIDAHAARHVQTLRTQVASENDLALPADGSPPAWLGHLVSLREDFRGVECVEAYARDIEFDSALRKHVQAAAPIYLAWDDKDKSDADRLHAAAAALPRCFLVEDLPADLADRMKAWRDTPAPHAPDERTAALYKTIEAWSAGWRQGLTSYRTLWQTWTTTPK